MAYTGITERETPSFTAGSKTAPNGCGQAAVVSLLRFWDRLPYPEATAVQDLYARHPPNTPRALMGCTPGHVERLCAQYGLATQRFAGDAATRRQALEDALRHGRPAIVLLDLGALGNGFLTAHYAVAHAFDDEGIYCTGMVRTRFGDTSRQRLPWPDFMAAWRCWYLPGWWHFGLDVRPAEPGRPSA